jgi:hypothetical protein
MRKAEIAAISADRDQWMRQATDASIAAAKSVVSADGPIRSSTAVGRLTNSEWDWICSSVVWAWISTRAEQAAVEGLDLERAIRTTRLDPDPWAIGAVVSVLPQLVERCPDLDWSAPVGAWSRDTIAEFLLVAFDLIKGAFAARDLAEEKIAGKIKPCDAEKTNADVVARQMYATAGNPRITVAEFNEDVPF